MRVLAIVTFLIGTMGVAALLALIVVGAGWWYSQMGEGTIAANDEDEQRHLIDTDAATEEEIAAATKARPRSGGGGNAAEPDPEPEVPKPAPVTVIVPPDVLFHSIEIRCPSGFARRGEFSSQRATVTAVPPGELCTVTFQGSQPAKTKVRAGQTVSCTFAPTNCVPS